MQASDKGSSPLMLINSRLKQAHPRLRILLRYRMAGITESAMVAYTHKYAVV